MRKLGNKFFKQDTMQTILELSHTKACAFFLESENYCTLNLPRYIDFDAILCFVKSKLKGKELKDVLANPKDMPSKFDGVNYKILVKKDAMYSYRPIQLVNPFLYYLLVNKITNLTNWNKIKERFQKFKVPQIEVASIPKVKGSVDKSHQAANVAYWWEGAEQRSLELALRYRYMFVTDITNCYSSIYTHSIAWAIMGKSKAKLNIGKGGQLGNEIDKFIQGMQYGQTNGIPQGSALFDFIAEIVLGYADKILSLKLRRIGIEKYRILRYKDDYKIFSNSKQEVERVSFLLHEVLAGLNLQLNIKKTHLTEDIISDSIKPDKLYYLSNAPFYLKKKHSVFTMASTLQQEAMYIHQFGKRYPNSGMIVKLLTLFAQGMPHKYSSSENKSVLISIFIDVALESPKTYKQVLLIVSWLLNKYSFSDEREKIVRLIYEKFQRFPNIGELQIWLQRIAFKLPTPIKFSEKICKIVANEPNVHLWNNAWLKAEFSNGFPDKLLCNSAIRDKLTPIIDVDEVSLFDEYNN